MTPTAPPPKNDIEALRAAHAEALRLVDSRAAFLATVSHELREPMNGVLGMARLLRETPLDPEQAGYVEALVASGETLVTLVNDILDLSRIDAGRLDFAPVDFAPRPFFERIAEVCRARAALKGLAFRLDLGDGLPDLVRGDPGRLRQVLVNLAGNAIKFTSEGGVAIVVAASAGEAGRHRLRIEVEDTGIGIPKEAAERLFGAYAQADGGVGRVYGGSGLGLMIAQKLARAMHGDVAVGPGRGDKGTRFAVAVELEAAEAPSQGAPRAALAGALVLVVDPEARTRGLYLDFARLWGMQGRGATTGREALLALEEAVLREAPFDFVLVDRRVGDMTAEDFARRVRDEGGHAHARIVLLSGTGVRGDAARAREAGIDAYLPSPVTAGVLLDGLQRLRGAKLGGLLTAHGLDEGRSRPLRLLVADDIPVNCKLLSVLLGRMGHEVVCVADGTEALDAVRRERFDAVLMDVQMPKMGGFEATRRIREIDGPAGRIPVIAVTANAMQSDVKACEAAGMNGHVAKPLDRGILLHALERALAA
ncbi:MAG: response regulator [Geminicoccaceae bacterium]|nr:response regulator [Geminicoccaceae bacterium]